MAELGQADQSVSGTERRSTPRLLRWAVVLGALGAAGCGDVTVGPPQWPSCPPFCHAGSTQ